MKISSVILSSSFLITRSLKFPHPSTILHPRCSFVSSVLLNMSSKRDLAVESDCETDDGVKFVEKKSKTLTTVVSTKKQQTSLDGFFPSKTVSTSTTIAPKGSKQRRYKVYCDLDGVLCDFDAGVRKIFNGRGIDQLKCHIAWAGITKADNFYGGLPWTRDGKELWKAIKPLQPDILTGVPGSRKSSRGEKATWCAAELGIKTNHVDFAAPKRAHELVSGVLKEDEEVVNVITCWSRNKHYKSGPNRILIDDTQKLKSYWVKKGGIFVHHTNTKNTLKQLQKLGIIDNHKSQNQDDN